jgi:hypothetical protein
MQSMIDGKFEVRHATVTNCEGKFGIDCWASDDSDEQKSTINIRLRLPISRQIAEQLDQNPQDVLLEALARLQELQATLLKAKDREVRSRKDALPRPLGFR